MFVRRVVLFLLIITEQCLSQTGQNYWKRLAAEELKRMTAVKQNTNVAKNVILFVGDGMGVNTVTATRIYKGGESHQLAFEKFPYVGLLKTYSANKMVPDSACSATALFCGIKANQETVGVDATVRKKDCTASLQPHARLDSLAAQALKHGKRVGLVTTTRVTHATPSALYAHSAYRKWECEATMPPDATQCKDIARQLVEDWPGKDLHVILGGGRQVMESNVTGTPEDPLDTWSCIRKDGRNLTEEYIRDKTQRNLKYSYVTNTKQLNAVDKDIDYLLGIFANGHMSYEDKRNRTPQGMPSISAMVEAAIKVLSRGPNGYFLMVEGGNIDMAHHRGWAKRAINEAAAMEDAVTVAQTLIDLDNTLLIVTSDHSHTLSINGYPLRGSNIFGIAQKSPHDGINYTTLSYGTGGADSFQYQIDIDEENNTNIVRQEPKLKDTDSFEYKQLAGIILDENSHGGGDVAIYATGARSFLFSGVHEQHYVYHAICCAAGLTHGSEACDIATPNQSSIYQAVHIAIYILIFICSCVATRIFI